VGIVVVVVGMVVVVVPNLVVVDVVVGLVVVVGKVVDEGRVVEVPDGLVVTTFCDPIILSHSTKLGILPQSAFHHVGCEENPELYHCKQ